MRAVLVLWTLRRRGPRDRPGWDPSTKSAAASFHRRGLHATLVSSGEVDPLDDADKLARRAAANARIIENLDRSVRERARAVIEWGDARGKHLTYVQGYRTFQAQGLLFAKGRTAPGEACTHGGVTQLAGSCRDHPNGARVTDARPGFSFHNYGLAVDLLDFGAAGDPLAYDQADWNLTNYAEVAEFARSCGWEWGGAWRTFRDRPHLEFHPGYGKTDAWKLVDLRGSDGYLPDGTFRA